MRLIFWVFCVLTLRAERGVQNQDTFIVIENQTSNVSLQLNDVFITEGYWMEEPEDVEPESIKNFWLKSTFSFGTEAGILFDLLLNENPIGKIDFCFFTTLNGSFGHLDLEWISHSDEVQINWYSKAVENEECDLKSLEWKTGTIPKKTWPVCYRLVVSNFVY